MERFRMGGGLGSRNMSREWFQWIDGRKVDWPAGELPHPKTVFNANFLNQFIAWRNYLSWVEQLHGVAESPFVYPGDDIQTASFWNQRIHFVMRGEWSPYWGLNGWIYKGQSIFDAAQFEVVRSDPAYDDAIDPSGSFHMTEYIKEVVENTPEPMMRGDDLQSKVREFLRRTRWQLDSCVANVRWDIRIMSCDNEIWRRTWDSKAGAYFWELLNTYTDRFYATIFFDYYEDTASRIDNIKDISTAVGPNIAKRTIIGTGDLNISGLPLVRDSESEAMVLGTAQSDGPIFPGSWPPVASYAGQRRTSQSLVFNIAIQPKDIIPPEFVPPAL